MTLGTTPQPADVVSELGASLPYTFPDAASRWLAEVGSTAPITFPTDFASKQSVKQVDITALSAMGTSHSFTGVNFGADYTGRLIFVIAFAVSKQTTATSGWTFSNGTIGGVAGSGPGSMLWWQSGSGTTVFVGNATMWASPSGTSGTISFGTTQQTRCICVVLSIANGSSTTSDIGTKDANSTGGSFTLDIPANGVLISGATKANANAITFTGVTGQGDQSPLSGYRIAWGWDNRLSAQTGRTVSFTSTGTAALVVGASSRVQG
ncbi:MAG: hypothetical protein ACTHJQ_22615 [Rhizobiaceae bacterium]